MAIVAEGSDAIRDALAAEARHGRNLIVVDAIHDDDLIAIGAAARDLVLITGGSGVAMGLPANFAKTGQISATKLDWQGQAGRCAILSGSCSEATRNQIATHAKTGAQHKIDVAGVMRGEVTIDGLLSWFWRRTDCRYSIHRHRQRRFSMCRQNLECKRLLTGLINYLVILPLRLLLLGLNV
jgi:uncharacterized protein YgbK (DUF1537 family)